MKVTGLERAIMGLIQEDRFYAEMILQMDRREDSKVLGGAAAVGVVPRPTLYYHPEIFENNTVETGKHLLKHEVGHLLLEHLQRLGGSMNKIQNVAADLAVNSFIDGFQGLKTKDEDGGWTYKPGCTVENLLPQFPSLVRGQTMEWYVEKLKQDGADQGNVGDPTDDHSKWGEPGTKSSEMDEMVVKGMIQDAVDRAHKAGGKVPDELRDLIKRLLASRNQWQRELQRFPQDAEICGSEDTWRRRNRRLGLQVPGTKKIRKVKIVGGIDVSGSVGGPLLELFYSEMDKIAEYAEVVAVFFDHAVQLTVPWDQVRKIKKIPGGGGTLFQPMLDEAKRLKADGLVMLTDGMNGDSIAKPKFPVIWAVPGQYEYAPPFGKRLTIEDPK